MCLEICGGTPQSIAQDVATIHSNQNLLTSVSYEKYTLGSNADFVDFSPKYNLTDVTKMLPQNLELLPMLSSYPHIPTFLDDMRLLFANPTNFINTAIAEAKAKGYSGYNVDFEPTTTASTADAVAYAKFLNTFADAMHGNGMILTVDVATWNGIWNNTLISLTNVDRVITMQTYVEKWDDFQTQMAIALKTISIQKLGIGLEVYTTPTNWTQRFELITQSKALEVDVWLMPLPQDLWSCISTWINE